MKGGLAASVIAAEAFMAVYPDFPGAIEISGTADEESGGFGGVAHLARLGYFSKPRVDHVIIPEPLNKDRICLGHRGVWWAEIETKGEIAHGSMPFLGDCAVRHMGAVLDAFEDELFPALDRKQTRMPVVPEGARRSTMNINSIHGGQTEDFRPGLPSPNVPDSCRLTIDRRFLLEEDLAEVKGEVTTILERLKRERPKFDYEIRDVMEVLPLMTERDAPVAEAVAQGIRDSVRPRAGLRHLARHLRPEARDPHRPSARLHRLWAGHSRPRPPARRMGRHCRYGRIRQGDGDRPRRAAARRAD